MDFIFLMKWIVGDQFPWILSTRHFKKAYQTIKRSLYSLSVQGTSGILSKRSFKDEILGVYPLDLHVVLATVTTEVVYTGLVKVRWIVFYNLTSIFGQVTWSLQTSLQVQMQWLLTCSARMIKWTYKNCILY